MNRRDSNPRSQQPGGYQDDGRWDMPRQAGQWQDGPARQAGGYRDPNEESLIRARRSERERRYASDLRGEGGSLSERHDRELGRGSGRGSGQGSDYRNDPRLRAGWVRRDHAEREGEYPIPNYDAAYGDTFSSFTSEDYGGRDRTPQSGGVGGGMHPSDTYRPTFGFSRSDYFSRDDYGDWRSYGERRGFLKRAGDEIASWFGDEDAAHRRELDHRGRGPSDYVRSDERIREDVNDSLTNDWRVDAGRIRVTVSEGEVTLDGTVDSRAEKRRAEDLADDVSGARHVQNNLRVGPGAIGSSSSVLSEDGNSGNGSI
ncbi:BON domain-containing protein [Novosphingobium sp. BL-8H]|uniref:BON domain-containing protein n=1 Tax=Novosphingobium sp. BL-8H TaxID=3127640 RepID=UPI00375660DE